MRAIVQLAVFGRVDRQVVGLVHRVGRIAVAGVAAARVRQAELVADLVGVGHRLSGDAAGGAAAAAGDVDGDAAGDDAVVDPVARVRGLVER